MPQDASFLKLLIDNMGLGDGPPSDPWAQPDVPPNAPADWLNTASKNIATTLNSAADAILPQATRALSTQLARGPAQSSDLLDPVLGKVTPIIGAVAEAMWPWEGVPQFPGNNIKPVELGGGFIEAALNAYPPVSAIPAATGRLAKAASAAGASALLESAPSTVRQLLAGAGKGAIAGAAAKQRDEPGADIPSTIGAAAEGALLGGSQARLGRGDASRVAQMAVDELAHRGAGPVAGGNIADTWFSALAKAVEQLPELIKSTPERILPEQRIPGKKIYHPKTGALLKDIPDTVLPGKTIPAETAAARIRAMLSGQNPREMQQVKLDEWLSQQPGDIKRSELLDMVQQGQAKFDEDILGGKPYTDASRAYDALRAQIREFDNAHPAARFGGPGPGYDTISELLAKHDELWDKLSNSKPMYESVTIPGGTNYREMLIKLPEPDNKLDRLSPDDQRRYNWLIHRDNAAGLNTQESEELADLENRHNFISAHFGGEPNLLAHIRMDDRVVDNKRTLFVQEIQSDWHAEGSRHGYGGLTELPQGYTVKRRPGGIRPVYDVLDPKGDVYVIGLSDPDDAKAIALDELNRARVPDAPFKQTWPKLAVQRILRYAADEGYDAIAFPATHEAVGEVEQWPKGYERSQDVAGIVRRYTDEIPKLLRQITGTEPTQDWSGKTNIIPITPQLRATLQQGQAMPYAIAGFSQDEEGNWQFDPTKAAMGVAFGAGIKKIDTSKMSITRQKVLGMYQEIPGIVDPGIRAKVGKTLTSIDRALWDPRVGLKQVQELVAKEQGGLLNSNQLAYFDAKRNPDMAAAMLVQEGLKKPIVRYMGEEGSLLLAEYLTYWDNIDVAKAMGKQAKEAVLAKDITHIAGTANLKRARQRVAYWQTQVKLGKITNAPRRLKLAQTTLRKAQAKYDVAKTAAEQKRAAKAAAKGTEVEQNRKFSTDISIADSEQAIAEFEATTDPAMMAKIRIGQQRMQALIEQVRQFAFDTELWPAPLVDNLRQEYPHYIPTRIIDYMGDGAPGTKSGDSISVRDQGIRANTLEGTSRIRENPIVSTERMIYQIYALGFRNQVFNELRNLRDASQTLRQEMLVLRTDVHDATKMKPGETFTVGPGMEKVTGFDHGKKLELVMPTDVAQTLAMISTIPKDLQSITKAMMVYKMLLTSRNPSFLPVNLARDMSTTLVGETIRSGGVKHLPEVAAEIIRLLPDVFAGITTGTFEGPRLREALSEGAGMGGFFSHQPDFISYLGLPSSMADRESQIATRAEQRIHDLAGYEFWGIRTEDGLLQVIKDLATMRPVQAAGERLEYAARLPGYTLARSRGEPKAIAVNNMRTASGVDFNELGTLSKFLNVLIPFFNPAMQSAKFGYRRIVEQTEAGRLSARAINYTVDTSNPNMYVAHSTGINPRWKAVLTGLTTLVTPTILAEVWNRRNPESSAAYDDIPDDIKDRGLVFILPGTQTDRRGNIRPNTIFIPTGQLSSILIATRTALGAVYEAPGRTWDDIAGGIFASLSPINSLTDTAMFPFVSTIAQLGLDKNAYTRRNIKSVAADENASPVAKAIAAGTGKVPGVRDILGRPSQVEFAMRDAGGGLGKGISDTSSLIRGGTTMPEGIPGLGMLTKPIIRHDIGGNLNRAQDQRLGGLSDIDFVNLGIPVPGEVGTDIRDVPLTTKERTRYQQLFNRNMQPVLSAIRKAKPPLSTTQRNTITNAIKIARDRARDEVYRTISSAERTRRKQQQQGQLDIRGTLKSIIGR